MTEPKEIVLRKCKQCLEVKDYNQYFRVGRYKCKQCLSTIQYQQLKDKNYFATKYIEQRDARLKYQNNYHETVFKPRKQKRELESQCEIHKEN
jgi:transposase-like protein